MQWNQTKTPPFRYRVARTTLTGHFGLDAPSRAAVVSSLAPVVVRMALLWSIATDPEMKQELATTRYKPRSTADESEISTAMFIFDLLLLLLLLYNHSHRRAPDCRRGPSGRHAAQHVVGE